MRLKLRILRLPCWRAVLQCASPDSHKVGEITRMTPKGRPSFMAPEIIRNGFHPVLERHVPGWARGYVTPDWGNV